MMPLDDFNVVIIPQPLGDIRDDLEEQIHAQTHIRRLENRNMQRRSDR